MVMSCPLDRHICRLWTSNSISTIIVRGPGSVSGDDGIVCYNMSPPRSHLEPENSQSRIPALASVLLGATSKGGGGKASALGDNTSRIFQRRGTVQELAEIHRKAQNTARPSRSTLQLNPITSLRLLTNFDRDGWTHIDRRLVVRFPDRRRGGHCSCGTQ